MFDNYEIKSPGNGGSEERPQVTSYDSADEHSIEHLIDVRRLVAKSEEDTTTIAKPKLGH